MKKLNGLVVEDHPVYAQGLKSVINKTKIFNKIGTVINGLEAINYLKENPVDVVFLDLEMSKLDGVSTALVIKKLNQNIKIIIISMYTNPVDIKTLLDNNIEGYVLKNSSNQEIYKVIYSVKNNCIYYNSLVIDIYNSLKEEKANTINSVNVKLTTTQKVVLQLICQGKKTIEIAETLNLSPNTIKRFRDQLHKKTKCKTNIELLNFTMKNKLF